MKRVINRSPESVERQKIYDVWRQLCRRCHDPSSPAFGAYGGRGIFVCDRWRASWLAFRADMGPRPSGHTVERVDNNRGYEPGNVRWATRQEQGLNTRQNVRLTWNGETLTLGEWARRTGLSFRRISERLRVGWSVERALSAPLAKMGPPKGTNVNAQRRAS